MANTIPRKPELTLALLHQMINGLASHEDIQDKIPQDLLDKLQTLESELKAAISQRIIKAGEAERATQVLNETNRRAIQTARRVRELLYSMYGKQDARLLNFGLDTLKNRWDRRRR